MELINLPSDMYTVNDLVAIYCNKLSPDSFLVGQILSSDTDCLLLSLISPDASADGWCLCFAKCLFRIEENSQYLRSIKKDFSPVDTSRFKSQPWDNFLTHAEEHKFVTQIKGFSGRRIMVGIPIDHSDNAVAIQRVYLDGSQGKVFHIKRNRIALMVCNSNTEQELQAAFQEGGT